MNLTSSTTIHRRWSVRFTVLAGVGLVLPMVLYAGTVRVTPVQATTAIQAKYVALGGASGILGLPITAELPASNGGAYQDFRNGSIYWRAPTGAHDILGNIRHFWLRDGGPRGDLGYPISDQIQGSIANTVYEEFENASMYSSAEKTTWEHRCPRWACKDSHAQRSCTPANVRLRTKENDRLSDIDKALGFLTTPLKKLFGKKLGWRSSGCIVHNAIGVPVRRAQHSTDGFWTIDLRLQSFDLYGLHYTFKDKDRFIRLEVHWNPAKALAAQTQPGRNNTITFGGLIVRDVPHSFSEVHPSHEFAVH